MLNTELPREGKHLVVSKYHRGFMVPISKPISKTGELDPEDVKARRVHLNYARTCLEFPEEAGTKLKITPDALKDLNRVYFYLAQTFIVKEDQGPEEVKPLFKKAI